MITIFVIYLFLVFVGYQASKEKNPYIRAHKKKWKNEKYYDRYIKWLNRKGGDLPIKEVKTKEEKELIDLNDLLAEITSVFAIKFISEGGSLEIDDLPEVVGQRTLFSQLFQNLIGNGLKYRDKKAPVVRVSVLDRGSEWEFIVADNGIGIDEKFHDKIFVIFQRLHSRDEFSGTGIGLAICKKIVEKYGGTIWVESKPGEGSEFHFTLAKS